MRLNAPQTGIGDDAPNYDLGLQSHEKADHSDPLCWDLERGAPGAPHPRRKGRFVFPNLTSGARSAGRDGKAAEPVHAGPPGMGKHLTAEPCNGRLAAWAAGGNGREFRSPLEQGSAGRGRVPSRLMSLGTQVHGRPGCRRKGVQGEERFRRDCCLRNPSPWPAGSTGCRRGRLPPSWCGFRTRYETQGV